MKAADLASLTDEMGLLLDWLRMAAERPGTVTVEDVELWRTQAEHLFLLVESEGHRKIASILARRQKARRKAAK